jgi:hypothetical protein
MTLKATCALFVADLDLLDPAQPDYVPQLGSSARDCTV